MPERWRIELLGGLRACSLPEKGRALTRFRTRKTGALLAYLAYYLHQEHSREVLIEVLWPSSALETGRNNLRLALASLRRQLEPPDVPSGSVLQADRNIIKLNAAAVTTDVAAFEASLLAASQAEDAERARLLAHAVELYHGPLLPGYYESWIPLEEERLEGLFVAAQSRLLNYLEQHGDFATALRIAQRTASVAPSHEAARADVRRIYDLIATANASRNGRGSLAADPDSTQKSKEDLSVKSGRGILKDNAAAPRRAKPKAAAKGAAKPQARQSWQHVPPQFTRFFDRETELTRLTELLQSQQPRLITLTGPGGSGKTRLSVEVARQLLEQEAPPWHGEVWFVSLSELQDAALIPDAIADTLGLPQATSRSVLEHMAQALAAQPVLLVLDNFEQIVREGAALLRKLLEQAPTLTCLITSRQRLNLAGELEYPVLPLPLPDASNSATPELLASCESVQLLVDRARLARPDFQLTRANAASVARLTTRLEGIPLALELAAARLAVLSPAQVLSSLEASFDFLTNRQPDAVPRHRSLRACIEWSYQLLPPTLQRFFAQLSVFCGGWTSEAAQVVCQERQALEYLEQLREASLIRVETIETDGAGEILSTRFRMFEILREYAGEKLTEFEKSNEVAAGLAQRHAEYYVALAEYAESGLGVAKPGAWRGWPFADLDNFRAVLRWARRTGDLEWGLRLAGALWWFWSAHGHLSEWREHLKQLLDQADQSNQTKTTTHKAVAPAVKAKAESCAGFLAFYQSDYPAACSYLESSLADARAINDLTGIATALNGLGAVALAQGDFDKARAEYEASLEVHRRRDDKHGIVVSLSSLAGVAQTQGDNDTALRLCSEALPLWKALNDQGGISWLLNIQGLVAESQGAYAAARDFQAQSLELRRSLGNKLGIATSLEGLGRVALAQEQDEVAYNSFAESLHIRQESGHQREIIICIEGLAGVWNARGEAVRAVRLLAATESLRAAMNAPRLPYNQSRYEATLATARKALTGAEFTIAWTIGQTYTIAQAIAEALQIMAK